jgi:phosphatidylserine/phosphatidylglycerophosphate/cardiolipin synthase-like enzyme
VRDSHAEVAFSPHGVATELVIKTIESARHSIHVAAYSFASKLIATALLEAHKRGIDVFVVVDKSNATDRYRAATFLANQGVTRVCRCG